MQGETEEILDCCRYGHFWRKGGAVSPSPKKVGLIAVGENPVCFDEAVATIMGANLDYIKTLTHTRKPKGRYALVDKEKIAFLLSNDEHWAGKTIRELDSKSIFYYVPTSGWAEAFRG